MNDMRFTPDAISRNLGHIALIGNSVPRRCGIATFTTHCYDAMRGQFPEMQIDLYAMDDEVEDLEYPADVSLISQHDRTSYSLAAKDIDESGAQAIWLQHEFGIFGGPAGDYILHLLARTRTPLITTLHTILERPSIDERRVMDALIARSSQLIVMAERGRDILRMVYGVSDASIHVIPHGVPDRAYVEPDSMKAPFGWEGRKVILTFGLLAPDKGIENMVRAMPTIVRDHPDALYVILGATHPNIVREQGETLRHRLKDMAVELGVEHNVEFVNRYVEQEDLLDYLQAADIYVTPYVNPAQITSGTLSYAVAMGKPVVSTPYVHAAEILADERGKLVPFADSDALAREVKSLLDDDGLRQGYAERAYACGRQMLWVELARRVGRLLIRARDGQPTKLPARRSYGALDPNLSAVLRMSDSTGMLQHSILSVPDRDHGYCIDDNCRALMLINRVEDLDVELRDKWTTIYASFVQHAWNGGAGRFRNFMAFDRSWCEDVGSEDSNGRALWSLGSTARDAPLAKHAEWARMMFDRCLPALSGLQPLRARAFAMLGASAMLEAVPEHERARALLREFGEHLIAHYHAERRTGWEWFESSLSYDNVRLSEALLRAGVRLGDERFIACGLTTLEWITELQQAPDGHFRSVGTESFGRTYADPLPFDQQPLEAQAMIEAAEAAFAVDPSARWVEAGEAAYGWFLGRNDLDRPLATREDGGCFDGLNPQGVNRNQGAESILALQFASCAIKRLSTAAQSVPKTVVAGTENLPA
ncbi:glycosyltransferase family 4 protein [Sphingobium subterraneum]|uniref:Glycosyltransferase involved in cell wall biosynthesis n=1 Tax=Sphingobium subterraneum TaxID=627688 RepID=A0A841J2F9_9SPHN|nr:glycosyltransferase family 4 protein [Sphingobium subterraneum]MBB6125369.1 glycosyltransferase involved in cell wall biosynthesis [Sphingobium subterraneum]